MSACVVGDGPDDSSAPAVGTSAAKLSAAERGRDVWFKDTFGGQKFFAILASGALGPDKTINIGFDNVARTPRAERFERWGVVNDPDCQANPNGGLDICADPNASGVVGIRKFQVGPDTYIYGAACAACHAGFDPVNPPTNPDEPSWANIHPSIGNQYLKVGDIFAANLPATDPRRLVFATWPRGAVDTTLLFSDGIYNPGVITAFWEQKKRTHFDVTQDGVSAGSQLRNGQGGEDDVGGKLAAIRVYTNIGMCFQDCTLPAQLTGQPIDVDACRANCADFPSEQKLDDLATFMASMTAPQFPGGPSDSDQYDRGLAVFNANCESCHDSSGQHNKVLSDDQMTLLLNDPQVTNTCRARTTNWDAGRLWAQFSSDQFKARTASIGKGYRTMPLGGIWATEPFLHNQSIGDWAPADATPAERAVYFSDAMHELMSDSRTPKVNPYVPVFSTPPGSSTPLCSDTLLNRGHTFGASLSESDKDALIYWLQYQ